MVSCPSSLMVPYELFVQHLSVVANNIIIVSFANKSFCSHKSHITDNLNLRLQLQLLCSLRIPRILRKKCRIDNDDNNDGFNAFNDDDDGVAPPLRSP